MSRAETTAMLSEQLERQVLSKFRLWGSEVKFSEGDRDRGGDTGARMRTWSGRRSSSASLP